MTGVINSIVSGFRYIIEVLSIIEYSSSIKLICGTTVQFLILIILVLNSIVRFSLIILLVLNIYIQFFIITNTTTELTSDILILYLILYTVFSISQISLHHHLQQLEQSFIVLLYNILFLLF